MIVTLKPREGASIRAAVVESGEHVVVALCPSCGASDARVRGTGIRDRTHDTYVAAARCLECGSEVGDLRCKMDTIFGLSEDEAVLSYGRGRVYGGSRRP